MTTRVVIIIIIIERLRLKRIGQKHDANLGPFLWENETKFLKKDFILHSHDWMFELFDRRVRLR